MADPKLFFLNPDGQESAELFRLGADGAVERLESAQNDAEGLPLLGLDEGIEIVSAELIAAGPGAPDIFVATDLSAAELLADHGMLEGDDVHIGDTLDFAPLGVGSDQGLEGSLVQDQGETGAQSPAATPVTYTQTLEFTDYFTIIVDDGTNDPPVTI